MKLKQKTTGQAVSMERFNVKRDKNVLLLRTDN